MPRQTMGKSSLLPQTRGTMFRPRTRTRRAHPLPQRALPRPHPLPLLLSRTRMGMPRQTTGKSSPLPRTRGTVFHPRTRMRIAHPLPQRALPHPHLLPLLLSRTRMGMPLPTTGKPSPLPRTRGTVFRPLPRKRTRMACPLPQRARVPLPLHPPPLLPLLRTQARMRLAHPWTQPRIFPTKLEGGAVRCGWRPNASSQEWRRTQ